MVTDDSSLPETAMARRSRAREVALQLLYQHDYNPGLDRPAIEDFVRARLNDRELEPFCLSLYDGVITHASELDSRIQAAAENWRLPRMAGVDRNVLRLGAYELLFAPDTPDPVALDEAIELARRYGTADSTAFVNGILDQLRAVARSETAPQQGSESAPQQPDTVPSQDVPVPDRQP
jgi:N utilization substance protein B